MRDRFYESLAAYRHGMESAPKHGFKEKLAALWPRQPAWQMGISFALLVLGVGAGYAIRPEKQHEVQQPDVAQLRGEVSNMRQMVALSLMQQQSAGERLRGVSWAYRVESSDTEVLSALLSTVNNDPSINVRIAAVDALHAFGASPVTRDGDRAIDPEADVAAGADRFDRAAGGFESHRRGAGVEEAELPMKRST